MSASQGDWNRYRAVASHLSRPGKPIIREDLLGISRHHVLDEPFSQALVGGADRGRYRVMIDDLIGSTDRYHVHFVASRERVRAIDDPHIGFPRLNFAPNISDLLFLAHRLQRDAQLVGEFPRRVAAGHLWGAYDKLGATQRRV